MTIIGVGVLAGTQAARRNSSAMLTQNIKRMCFIIFSSPSWPDACLNLFNYIANCFFFNTPRRCNRIALPVQVQSCAVRVQLPYYAAAVIEWNISRHRPLRGRLTRIGPPPRCSFLRTGFHPPSGTMECDVAPRRAFGICNPRTLRLNA